MMLRVDTTADALVSLLREGELELQILVEKAIASGALGTAKFRRRQMTEVRAHLIDLGEKTAPLIPPLIEEAYGQGLALSEIEGGLEKGATVPDLPAGSFTGFDRDSIEEIAANLTTNIEDAIRTVGRRTEDVFRTLGLRASATGLLTGQPVQQTAQLLERRIREQGFTAFVDKRGAQWNLSSYSEMAVRTTTREAVTTATANRLLARGRTLVTVSSHRTSCPICDPYDGKTFTLIDGDDSGFPFLDQRPPIHPNAVMEGTPVEAIGDLQAGSRARWSGPVIDLTTDSGIRLTVGPNHPVLTRRGWVRAEELHVGDHVVRDRRHQRVGATGGPAVGHLRSATPHADLDERPALVEDVFDALAATGLSARVAASPGHFHGDGNFCEGEVDVVLAERLLRHPSDVALSEPVGDLALQVALKSSASFAASSVTDEPLVGELFSTDSSVCLTCGSRTDGDAVLPQATPDSAIGDSVVGSQLGNGFSGFVSGDRFPRDVDAAALAAFLAAAERDSPLDEMWAQHGAVDTGLARELEERFASVVTHDEIVNLGVREFHGWAFDLDTSSRAYFAAGLVVHNCRHVITAARRGPGESRPRERRSPVTPGPGVQGRLGGGEPPRPPSDPRANARDDDDELLETYTAPDGREVEVWRKSFEHATRTRTRKRMVTLPRIETAIERPDDDAPDKVFRDRRHVYGFVLTVAQWFLVVVERNDDGRKDKFITAFTSPNPPPTLDER